MRHRGERSHDPSLVRVVGEFALGVAQRALEPADRALYVAKLIENAKQGDPRAIMTLGNLNMSEALPMLAADAKSGQPWAATARRAVVLLGKGADVLPEIAHDAVNAEGKMERAAAIMDLSKIGGREAIFRSKRRWMRSIR